ncbi:MAG: VIT domain-containing protein [Lysobacteraceae bacterium]
METLRGEKPIELQSLAVSAHLRGGLAETVVRMTFHNPNDRQLEGNLQFPLLDGQQVTGFALDFDGHLRPAVPVQKSRGRQVFEDIERRNVDPALLEKTQGNNFRLRVYPIPANGDRIVELRYTEPLVRQERWRRYRLPLAYGSTVDDFTLEIDSDATARPQASGIFGVLPFKSERGLFQARVARQKFALKGDVELLLRTPRKPQASVEVRGDNTFFVAELPIESRSTPRKPPSRIGLLWDSSMSAGKHDHADELALLDTYFKALGAGNVRLIRLRDRAEPAQDFRIVDGDWQALREALEATQYDGASALADWQPETGIGEYLLVSDGLLNYGPLGFGKLAPGQRLYAINASASADRDRLRALAESSGGQLVELQSGRVAEAVETLLTEHPRIVSLSGDGLADLETAPGGGADGYLRVAGRLLSKSATLKVKLGNGSESEVTINPDAPKSPLAAQTWASYRLARLAAQPELNRKAIAQLGARFGMATSETSLIVLDRVEDYVEHDIAPPSELAQAFAALLNERNAQRESARDSHAEEVLAAFKQRVEWWERDFPKGEPPKPEKRDVRNTGPSDNRSDSSNGSLFGRAEPGSSIIVENEEADVRREISTATDGTYRAPSLPIGNYRVTMKRSDGTESVRDHVFVSVGTGTPVNFTSVDGAPLETIIVSSNAVNPIDVSSVESDTVLSEEMIESAPLERNTTRVALLAPGTIRDEESDSTPESQVSIDIKGWQSDAPYVAELKAASADAVYADYLKLRPNHAESVGFYLDVADVLIERDQKPLALRVLSNIAEMDLDNRHVLRVLGYRLMQAGEPGLAVPVFEQILRMADYEPQSFRDLGNALAAAGREQEAIDALSEVVLRPWDGRFSDIELIALTELNAIVANAKTTLDAGRLDPRLRRNLPLDLRVVLTWDADNSDMDLWVTDPNGEKCFYSHKLTYQGGHMSNDFTGGYGPEEFALRIAKPGRYKVEVNYFGDRQQQVAGPTSLQLRFTTKFGTTRTEEKLVSLRLTETSGSTLVGEFDVE